MIFSNKSFLEGQNQLNSSTQKLDPHPPTSKNHYSSHRAHKPPIRNFSKGNNNNTAGYSTLNQHHPPEKSTERNRHLMRSYTTGSPYQQSPLNQKFRRQGSNTSIGSQGGLLGTYQTSKETTMGTSGAISPTHPLNTSKYSADSQGGIFATTKATSSRMGQSQNLGTGLNSSFNSESKNTEELHLARQMSSGGAQWRTKYLEEKKRNEALETKLEEQLALIDKLRDECRQQAERNETIKILSKDLERENRTLETRVNEFKERLKFEKESQEKKSKTEAKELENWERLGRRYLIFHKEVVSLAKRLKDMKPEWRPNLQNEKVFTKEVLRELWEQLRNLTLEKEQRESAEAFMSNKDFINTHFSEKKTIINKTGSQKSRIETELFMASMGFLDDLLTNIDEINSTFDDCVLDEQGVLDADKLFPSLVCFFERVDKMRSRGEFKTLMREYYK